MLGVWAIFIQYAARIFYLYIASVSELMDEYLVDDVVMYT